MLNRFVATLLLSSAIASPVRAQSAAEPAPVAPDATSAPQDDAPQDIVVTAQRRAERLQDVPLSVTAVSQETLLTRGINNISQLNQAAPSLQVEAGDQNIQVRGIGTFAFQNSLETSVAIAQDEVNLVNPILGSAVGNFYDVAQVEVLNGPQGLLFGKNASAGLINIVTRRPEIGRYGASFDVETLYRPTTPTNGTGVNSQATLNIPVSTNSALRINALYSTQRPLSKFVGTGRCDCGLDQFGVRAKYLIEFTPALSLYVIGDYSEEHGVASFFDRNYSYLQANSPVRALLASVGITPGADNLTLAGNGDTYRDAKRGGVQAKLSYELASGIEISNILAYKAARRVQNIDSDSTNLNGTDINRADVKFNQITNELRVALPAGRLSGQAGLFFYRGNTDVVSQLAGNNFQSAAALPNFPFCVGAGPIGTGGGQCARRNVAFLGFDRNYDLVSTSYAAFGQLTFEVFPGLKAIAGGRVTHDDLKIDALQNQANYFVRLGVPLAFKGDTSNTDFSYRVGGQYNVDRDVMIYATYARGYKGPGFAEAVPVAGFSPIIDPEVNRNVEAGIKSTLLDSRIVLNVSAFRSKYSNLQISSFDASVGSSIIQNAASALTKGIEATTSLRPFRGLAINAGATYVDAKFLDFPGATCGIGQTTPSCAVNNTYNAAGVRISPKFLGNVQAEYEWALGGSVRAFVEGNVTHRSSFAPGVANRDLLKIAANQVYGASMGIRDSAGWRIQVFCRNCTDERVPAGINQDPGEAVARRLGVTRTFGFQSVRQWGLRFGFDF